MHIETVIECLGERIDALVRDNAKRGSRARYRRAVERRMRDLEASAAHCSWALTAGCFGPDYTIRYHDKLRVMHEVPLAWRRDSLERSAARARAILERLGAKR
jgi:hypothetical protein